VRLGDFRGLRSDLTILVDCEVAVAEWQDAIAAKFRQEQGYWVVPAPFAL
jgi:hypothetical protein